METTALPLKNRDVFAGIGQVATEAISVLSDKAANEFEKGYVAACAMQSIKSKLSDEIMRPIMALQGSTLGFKTDRDRDGGYDIDTVRNCAVVAALTGLRFHGNEWNIIAGNCYVTVNGCDRLFNQLCEFPPRHEPGVVIFDEANRRATVKYRITYKLKGQPEQTREQEIATKLAYTKSGMLLTTDDAVLGKARRKLLWGLLRELRGIEIGDGAAEGERNITPGRHGNAQPDTTVETLDVEVRP